MNNKATAPHKQFAIRWIAVVSLGLLGSVSEGVCRFWHVADIPTYRADPYLGYIPSSNQTGQFLRKYTFSLNSQSMRMTGECRPGSDTVLLLGDSIVFGGVWISQERTVGAQLQDKLSLSTPRYQVCPLGAASWALENELRVLRSRPALAKSRVIVLVSNSGDFGLPSVWSNPLTHPLEKPTSALVFFIRKKLFGGAEPIQSTVTPDAIRQWHNSVKIFLQTYKGNIIWVVYPMIHEDLSVNKDFGYLKHISPPNIKWINVSSDRRWHSDTYRDDIHPNDHGAAVLADIIAKQILAIPHEPKTR